MRNEKGGAEGWQDYWKEGEEMRKEELEIRNEPFDYRSG